MKYVAAIPIVWLALHMGIIFAPFAALAIMLIRTVKKVWLLAALAFFGLSLGWVYLESRWLYSRGYPETPKTAVVTTTGSTTMKMGEIFPMDIVATDITIPVNAMQADLTFNPNVMAVRGIHVTRSFANVFTTKSYDNTQGTITLTGGLANPGTSKKAITFGTIYFQAIGSGSTTVAFAPTSMVLANDGRGTNVVARLSPQTYAVEQTSLTALEVQEQSAKYTDDFFADDHGKDQHLFLPPDTGAPVSEIHEVTAPRATSRWLAELARIDDFLLRFWPSLFDRSSVQ